MINLKIQNTWDLLTFILHRSSRWCRRSHSFSRGPGRVMTFEAQLTRLVTWQQLWKTSLLLFCFRISDSKWKQKLLYVKRVGYFSFCLMQLFTLLWKTGWLIIQAIESTATVFIFSKGFSLSSTTDWDHNKVYITHDALIHKTQEHLWKTTTNSDISARVETRDTRGLLQTRELLASGAPWLTLEKPHNRWIVPGSLKSRKMQHLYIRGTGVWVLAPWLKECNILYPLSGQVCLELSI